MSSCIGSHHQLYKKVSRPFNVIESSWGPYQYRNIIVFEILWFFLGQSCSFDCNPEWCIGHSVSCRLPDLGYMFQIFFLKINFKINKMFLDFGNLFCSCNCLFCCWRTLICSNGSGRQKPDILPVWLFYCRAGTGQTSKWSLSCWKFWNRVCWRTLLLLLLFSLVNLEGKLMFKLLLWWVAF